MTDDPGEAHLPVDKATRATGGAAQRLVGRGSGMPVPPPRSARREVRKQRKQRKRLTRAGVLVLVAALGAGAVSWVRTGDIPFRGSSDKQEIAPSDLIRKTYTMVLGHRNAEGLVDLLMVLGAGDDSSKSSVLLMPSTTVVEIPAFGADSIGEALQFGGRPLLQTSVANALGVDIGPVLVLDDAQLLAMFQPTEPMEVRLRAPIGNELEEGQHSFSAQEAADRITKYPAETPEFQHLVTVHAIADAWFAAIKDDEVFKRIEEQIPEAPAEDADALKERKEIIGILRALANGERRFDTVPLDTSNSPGLDSARIDIQKIGAVVERAFPYALLGSGVRPRVEILNGAGGIAITPPAAARLVRGGFQVVLTGIKPSFDQEETQILYYDDEHRASAERIATLLGLGNVLINRKPVGVADVTVVLGADYVPDPKYSLKRE